MPWNEEGPCSLPMEVYHGMGTGMGKAEKWSWWPLFIVMFTSGASADTS